MIEIVSTKDVHSLLVGIGFPPEKNGTNIVPRGKERPVSTEKDPIYLEEKILKLDCLSLGPSTKY